MKNSPSEIGESPWAPIVTGGSGREVAHPVRSPVVSIGKGAQNDLALDDDSISTNHARLEFSAGTWRLTDLESRNGTFVDGARLPANVPTALADGSQVAFGALKAHFRAGAPPPPTDRPLAATAAAPAPPARSRSTGLRLPVWLVVLIVLAIIVAVLVLSMGPTIPEALPVEVGAMIIEALAPPLAA